MKKILATLILALCGASTFPNTLPAQTIKAGYTSRTNFYLPFFLAQKKGLYKEQGLEVELILMGGSAIHLQALVAGEIHLANINPDGVILFNEKGGNLKIIAGIVNAAPYILVGGKAYRKVSDLKGARLGVASLVGGATTFLLEYLRAKGLHYPQDYSLSVIAGGTPARLAALESGAVAGAVLGIPISDMAIDRGFHYLGDVREVIPQYQFTAVHINPAWAEKNRTTVVKFLKAHIQTLRWIHDHPAEAADFYSKELAVKGEYARKGIDYFTKNHLYPQDGSVSLEGLKANIEVQHKLGLLTAKPLPSPDKYVDLSYIQQAQNELGMARGVK